MAKAERDLIGLRVIRDSDLAEGTKGSYVRGWRRWEDICEQSGVDAVDASWEDVVAWLRSGPMDPQYVKNVRNAVGFVYRALDKASPAHDRRVQAEIYGAERFGLEEPYDAVTWGRLMQAQADYKAWCGRHDAVGSRENGEQVARYLRELAGEYGYAHVQMASVGVSRYLEGEGFPSTNQHPAVLAVLTECRQRPSNKSAGRPWNPHGEGVQVQERWPRQWERWCASEGIDPGEASPADALRYLAGLEPQRDASRRVGVLSKWYEGQRDPFSAPEVLEWRKEYAKKVKDGSLPALKRRKSVGEVLALFDVASEEVVDVPVGLTRAEVARVGKVTGRLVSTETVEKYGEEWARFRNWFEGRAIPVERLGVWHVLVYVDELSETLKVASLRSVLNGLCYGFNLHGFDQNPAASEKVAARIKELAMERKEKPDQLDPIRLADLEVLVASAAENRPHEKSKQAVLRGATDVTMFGMQSDGLLRGNECASAKWKHINTMPDGSGSLFIPESKTDRFGVGEYTYLSKRTMGWLHQLRHLKEAFGIPAGLEDSVLGLGVNGVSNHIRAACAYAGLEGRFGVRSCRIGMAQELALAGFGLSMIMQAGRWTDPKMPRYYIRELKVHESAVAELHRMIAKGHHKVYGEAKGYDIVCAFHVLKYGR